LPRRARGRRRARGLTQTAESGVEVWVPPLHELPEQWERDNALFQYRLFKRSGWVGKISVVIIIGGLLLMFAADAYRALVG
jgi:hypothetical protein